MNFRPPDHFHLRASKSLSLTALIAVLLTGCACDEFWDEMTTEVAAAEFTGAPECNLGEWSQLSKNAAEYAGRADPHILETSRRDAERECNRAAESKMRKASKSIK